MAIQGFITISLDDATLRKIAGFSGLRSELTDTISLGLDEGTEIVAQTAEDNTWVAFQKPTGNINFPISYFCTYLGPGSYRKGRI